MAIRFRCDNPQCSKAIFAPDSLAGRQVKCPACGAVLRIPCPETVLELEPMVSETPPACSAVPAPKLAQQPGRTRPLGLAKEYLHAIRYGGSNFRSIFLLVLYIVGIGLVLSFVGGLLQILPFVGALVGLAIQLTIGGLFLRYYMDVVTSSLEGVDMAPSLPEFKLTENITMGMKGLGILAVYVMPLVTIPLLPLGLLALSYTDDNRTFDVPWAFRAVMKRPRKIAALWLALLLWGAVAVGVGYALWACLATIVSALVAVGTGGLLLAVVTYVLGSLSIGAVTTMFLCVIFRCIGMLGRYNEDLLELLPEDAGVGRTALYVGAGLVVSVIVLGWVVPWLLG